MIGEYSIIRYVPQPEREESVNLGVVVVSGTTGELWTRFRDASSFVGYPPHLKPNRVVIQSFEKHLQELTRSESNANFSKILGTMRHDLQNTIQITEPHSCTFENPKEFVVEIFKDLVAPPEFKSEIRKR